MKIAFFEVQNWERSHLQNAFANHEVKLFDEELDEDNLNQIKDFEIISVFIYSKIDKKKVSKLEKLRLVATRSTGYDHIDLEACKKQNIVVCNVSKYADITVAEHTFALILSLSRKIHDLYELTRQGIFGCPGVQGFELNGKVLGVLGTGSIGRRVMSIAKCFNMQIWAYDKYPNEELAQKLGFKYIDLQPLLRKADVLTLHLPLTTETYHIINKENLALMKKEAIIINTARGGLVDTEALTDALENKRLGGAALDVVEAESSIREEAQLLLDELPRKKLATMLRTHILLRLPNVIITPHCAFNSEESLKRLVNTTIENVRAFIQGKPQNVVN
jgi:D-lactate dehydrogenase